MCFLKSRFAGLAVLGACLMHANPVAAQSAPGFSMTTKMSVEMDTGGLKHMEIKTEATKTHVRLSIDGTFAPTTAGMYVVFDLAGSTMTTVMPYLKTASTTDSAARHSALSQALKGKLKGEPKLEVEDKGAGEPVLGLQTHRYHVKSETTTIYTMRSGSCEKTEVEDSELWNATTLELPPAYTDALLSVAGLVGDAGTRLNEMKRARMKGVTVKSVSTLAIHVDAGPAATSNSSSELTAFSKGDIENSRFAVPDGYRNTNSSQIMNNPIMANIDSATWAGAMATATENALKRMCEPLGKKP
jgi:hypothetical protein